ASRARHADDENRHIGIIAPALDSGEILRPIRAHGPFHALPMRGRVKENALVSVDQPTQIVGPLEMCERIIVGAYDDAFTHFQRANDLRRLVNRDQRVFFDPASHRERVERTMSSYGPEYFAAIQGWGNDSDVPIFIVGMPRSGS